MLRKAKDINRDMYTSWKIIYNNKLFRVYVEEHTLIPLP